MTLIVNFKQYGSAAALTATFGNKWLYIGRANPHYNLKASPLANPYRVRDFGHHLGATLPYYRRHLWQRIQAGDEAVLNALQAIDEETVLVCWCDGACHGQVVRAAAAWLRAVVRWGPRMAHWSSNGFGKRFWQARPRMVYPQK